MDEFDTLDSEELKVEYLFNLLKPVAEKISGKTRDVRTDYEVQCSGKYCNRPVRIIMDESTGGLKVELKLNNTTGTININYDPELINEDDTADPDWDNGGMKRFLIESGFYLEDYPESLEEQKKVFCIIDPAELEKIKTLMKRLGIGWINVDASVLRCGLFESLFNAEEILNIVYAMHSFARHFEKGDKIVAPQPSVILGGVAINPELVADIMVCPYCKSNVSVKSDRKCPNCGAGL